MAYRIASEEDAFELLERLNEGYRIPDISDVQLEDWPKFQIRIDGEDFHGTIPTRIMPTLLELQRIVHRLYCRTTYGDENLRRLSKREKEDLELLVRVGPGSSWFETLLSHPLTKTIEAAVSKMTPEQITAVVLTFGIAATSLIAWKAWLNHRFRERELDQTVALSRLEKEKMEILARTADQVPAARIIADAVDEVRGSVLGKLKPDDALQLGPREAVQEQPPVTISGRTAKEVIRSERAEPTERLIDDTFMLRSADFSKPGAIRVEIEQLADARIFRADIPSGVLDPAQTRALRDRSWERQSLRLSVLVRDRDGVYGNAKIVAVAPPTGSDSDGERESG